MGSCYSRKAHDGKCSYSDVQMASTKVEETSHLARLTPYTRNLVSSFSLKKNVTSHPKCEPSSLLAYNANEQSEKFQKSTSSSTFQSNIPRIGRNSIPAAGSTESSHSSLDSNCNKNEDVELHFVNNNAMSVMTNVSDSVLINPPKAPKKATEPKVEKKSAGTENSYSKISTTGKTDEKIVPSRIPAKFSAHIMGFPRPQVPQYVGKTGAHALSHLNSDNQFAPKLHPHSSEKLISEKQSISANEIVVDFLDEQDPMQSPPHATSGGDSQDSMTDIDSGLGNSLMEKGKQEDADTLKDVEYLESCEDSPINHVTPNNNESPSVAKATYGLKNLKLDDKTCLRSPMYRREPNGKWIVDDKHIGLLQKHLKSETGNQLQSGLQLYLNSSPSIPRYKTDSYDTFSSYASYRGLLSYKRQTNKKQLDNTSHSTVKFEKGYQSDSSGIPKVKKTTSKEVSYSKVPRSMLNLSGPDRSVMNLTAIRKTSYKIDLPSDSKQSSPDSDEKSDSIGNGIASPVSELENREFLIDDEIADQPGLISFENSKMGNSGTPSLQQSVTELHALQQAASSIKKRSDSQGSYSSRIFRDRSNTEGRDSLIIGSDMCSSCSSIGSDDLMLDYEKTCDSFPDGTINEGPASPVKQKVVDGDSVAEDKVLPLRRERKSITESEERTRKWLYRRSSGPFYGGSSGNPLGKADWRLRSVSLPLRPPRQMIVTEGEDGSIKLDPSSYRLLCQDLNGVKTLLLRLKSVIQEAETLNPFDQTNPKNIFYHNLAHSDFPSGTVFHTEENQDVESCSAILLLQENIDMRRQLVLLQQQLEEKDHTIHLLQQQMTKYTNFHNPDCGNICTNNAATQTDRIKSLTGSLSGSSSSADDSSETLVSVQDAFEEHFSKTFKEQDKFRNEMEKVTKSLSNLNQNLRVTMKKYPYLQNRSLSSSELSCYQKNS